MSSECNLKKSLKDYQYFANLRKQIKANAKFNSVQPTLIPLNNILQENPEKIPLLLSDTRKDINIKIHIPDLRIPLCTSRHQAEKSTLFNRDYLKSPNKVYIKKPQTTDNSKITLETKQLNKGLLNDYVELVNKRSLILRNFSQSFSDIDQIQRETNEYLLKYYGIDSFYRQIIENTVTSILIIFQAGTYRSTKQIHEKYCNEQSFKNTKESQRIVISLSLSYTLSQKQIERLNIPTKKLKYKTRLEQFQSYFKEKDESNFEKKKQEYDAKFAKINDDKQQQQKFDKKRFLKDKMLECEFRQKGISNIKKSVYENEMKNIKIEKPTNPKIRIRQSRKNDMEEYLTKVQSEDHLRRKYITNIKEQQFDQAIKTQEIIRQREIKNATENKQLLDQLKLEDEFTNQSKLGRILSVQQLSERKLSNSTGTSGSQLFEILSKSSKMMKNQNKRFIKNLRNSQKSTNKQFELLSQKYKKFQELCELGDNLDALEI